MKKLVFAALLAAFSVGCSDDKPVLQVYSWSDYVSDVVISEFEQKYNCSVKISSFDSNEAMYAKLKAGAGGKMFGSVTAKEISDELKRLFSTEIDKKKINLPVAIKSFGEYTAEIKLYPEVAAKIKVFAKEQE